MAHGDIVSFTQKLDHGCPPGSSFVIIAKPLKKKKRGIGIRFAASRKTALVLTISVAEDGMVTSRLLIDGFDTTETRTTAVLPLEKSYIFELSFTRSDVKVFFNNTRIMTFNHCTKLEKITSLHIDGTLKLEEVVIKLYQGNGRTQVLYPLTGSSNEVERKPEPVQCAYTTTPSETKTKIASPEPEEPLSPLCKSNGDLEPVAPESCPVAILTPMGLLIPPNLPPAILIKQTARAESEQLHSAPLPLGSIQHTQETMYWGTDNHITTDELAAQLNNLCKSISETRNVNVADDSGKEHYLYLSERLHKSNPAENPRIATALNGIEKEVQIIYKEAPALMKMLESIAEDKKAEACVRKRSEHSGIAASGHAKAYQMSKQGTIRIEMSSSGVPTHHIGIVKTALSSSLDHMEDNDAISTVLPCKLTQKNKTSANTTSNKGDTPPVRSGDSTTSSDADVAGRTQSHIYCNIPQKSHIYCNTPAFDKSGTSGCKRDVLQKAQKAFPTSRDARPKKHEHEDASTHNPSMKPMSKDHMGPTQVSNTAAKVEQHHSRVEKRDSHNDELLEGKQRNCADGGKNMGKTTYNKLPSSVDESDYEKYWCFDKAQKLAGTLESKLSAFEGKISGGNRKYAQASKVEHKMSGMVTNTVRHSCENTVSSKWKAKLDHGSNTTNQRDSKTTETGELSQRL